MLNVVFLLCFLVLGHCAEPASAVEGTPLKPEEILKLRNYELNVQNVELQLELLRRDLDRLKGERGRYHEELYKSYGLGQEWKIDLQQGIWFKAPDSGPGNTETKGKP
jgi:hypothetical protein